VEISRDRKFMSVGIIIFLLVILSNFLDGSRKVPAAAKTAAAAPVAYLDADTGCEYLLLPGAGLTPRLEPNGRQRCHVPPSAPATGGAAKGPPPVAPASHGTKAAPPGQTSPHS
jgi:hypothetical protein